MKPQYIRVDTDGDKFYYSDKEMTKLHREDGPACEFVSGTKFWYRNGNLHREDGPAREWSQDGAKEWWVHGQPHRDNGPAIETPNGSREWYIKGKRHREDGPACEFSTGVKWWYIDGLQLTEVEFKARKSPHNGKKVTVDGIEYTLQA